jgi:signal transduction histidine kinase
LHRHPDRTETALRDVIATGRGSLAEMRRLLGVVRGEPRFAPQPGVGTLPVLVDQVRAAGTPVAWRIDGTPVPLPAGVDLSAYRIVQEALTNTRKHAGTGAAATVALTFHPDRLEIDVADDGPGPAPISGGDVSGGDGSGLRGIAERVAMLGGALSVGPRAGGGFGVRAVLPLDDLPGDERRLTSPAQVLAGDPEPAGSPA